uniref:Uncharacterized protein n=1 Tax=Astatotilapia calliptera TaxID=8154 RepID=A0A3P8Q2P6_ASTCA
VAHRSNRRLLGVHSGRAACSAVRSAATMLYSGLIHDRLQNIYFLPNGVVSFINKSWDSDWSSAMYNSSTQPNNPYLCVTLKRPRSNTIYCGTNHLANNNSHYYI